MTCIHVVTVVAEQSNREDGDSGKAPGAEYESGAAAKRDHCCQGKLIHLYTCTPVTLNDREVRADPLTGSELNFI